ncbi:MAG: zf-HC2 domain-containing protein [Verrucomicrobia bacterium]|nr:zf-HC2 domain-containing protein [Verrucomicrobiota bacterium]
MKDSEFIELLNLYLDHEISAADAARLEAEVQASPERRRVYQQYCRMQKACTLLAKDFVDESVPADNRKVVAFEEARRSPWGASTFAFGGAVAAAACLAVFFVTRNNATAPAGAPALNVAAVTAPAPVVPPAETKVVVAPATGGLALDNGIGRTVSMPLTRRNELQPVIATRALFLANAPGAQPVAATEAAPQLDWINSLQIAPMQRVPAEDLRFESSAADASKNATFTSRNRPLSQGVVEKTAFQITK